MSKAAATSAGSSGSQARSVRRSETRRGRDTPQGCLTGAGWPDVGECGRIAQVLVLGRLPRVRASGPDRATPQPTKGRHRERAPASGPVAGGHALGPHLTPRPARNRRRRRHERLHRRDRQAPGRPRRRGRGLHPRHRRRACPPPSSSRPVSSCGTSRLARSSRWPRKTCRRCSARSRPASCGSRPSTTPGTSTSCTRTTGSRGRSARWRRTAGRCRWSTRCTRWRR